MRLESTRKPAQVRLALGVALCAAIFWGTAAVHADEGMWVFNNLPYKHLKDQHGFTATPEWVDHLRLSAVRFNNGGSGSFVSADGLIMTNHHVGADTLQKLSTPAKNYYKIGFHASTREAEPKAPDLELNVLVGISDVTAKVTAAVKEGMTDAQAAKARRAAMADIEKESLQKTGLRSDVVTLYQGGQYALYTYKKYTDIRLVFAPEFDIAFFGGDPDNFEFPRYDLDVCFFRAYENDKPAKIEHHLKWSANGAAENELIFVAGHPGRTSRLFTVDNLEYLRDTGFPFLLKFLKSKEAELIAYGARGEEQARQAKEDLFSYQNSLKARKGGLEGLQDKALMARKADKENRLRKAVAANPEKQSKYGAAWEKIAAAQKTAGETLIPFNMLERGRAFDSRLVEIGRTLVRLAAEKPKPNAERLREFGDANLESLELDLFSSAPIYPEYEIYKLTQSLAFWKAQVGDNDPLVQKILGDRAPQAVAAELIQGSKLADIEVRKKLAYGGQAAINASDDPAIRLALAVDPAARAVRKIREDRVEGVETTQYALIARAIFEEQGDSTYPDATFTLRLAFGTIKGYEQNGVAIPPFTQFAGLFERANKFQNKPPYEVPPSWLDAKKSGKLPLDTPFNFVSTADIIGGNSGSPVVNRKNEVVGLIFDGNIQSLVLDFAYDDVQARAVSVDSRAIVTALEHVYKADALVKELTGK